MNRPLVLSQVFPPQSGGSGRWLHEVYRRLPDLDPVVVTEVRDDADVFDRESDLNIKRFPMEMEARGIKSVSALRDYLRLYKILKRLVREHDISELHVGKCLPEGWLAWLLKKRLGIPYICYVHGEDVELARTSREYTLMVRRVLSSADRVIANSQNTCSLLFQHWPVRDDQVSVVHPGVDVDHFSPGDLNDSFRSEQGWESKRVLLTVGRLQRRKGHDTMIRAMPEVLRAVPDALYTVVGNGEDLGYLRDLARDAKVEPNVQFLTDLDDTQLVQAYQNCDLFALPNRAIGGDIEGFGMVLVEAQACGKPVLAGDSGGTRETMIVGESGFIVDCTTPEPLAAEVIRLLTMNDEKLAEIGQKGRRWVEDHLSWDSLAGAVRDCFIGTPTPHH